MASRLAKAPLLQAKRQFAAQAAVAAKQAELGSASGQVNTNCYIRMKLYAVTRVNYVSNNLATFQ